MFTHNNSQENVKTEVNQYLPETYQLAMPIKKFLIAEVKTAIKDLKDKKAHGYDLVRPRLLREMLHEEVKFIMHF